MSKSTSSNSKRNIGLLAGLTVIASFNISHAQTVFESKAKKILERISSTKVALDNSLLQQMVPFVERGDLKGAAQIATTHPNFLNVTIKHMALQMSTREETRRIPMNDFAASVVGITRDNGDARLLLTGNFFYRADAARVPAAIAVRSDIVNDILKSNNHYQDLEKIGIDLGQVLVRVDGQLLANSENAAVANPDPAGVLTSRAFMGAHAIAGTNRRPVEFTFREFLCMPIEEWADTKASDLRIGRDIDRFPGGDHMKFLTTCKGCHTGMDGFRGAFARWDFQGDRILNANAEAARPGGFDANLVSNKLNANNTVYASGYTTTNNTFVNNSRQPANEELIGWRGSVNSGTGVAQFGAIVSNSKRFSQCMVKRVFDAVCRTDLKPSMNMELLTSQAVIFEANNYNLKKLAEEVVTVPSCLGEG